MTTINYCIYQLHVFLLIATKKAGGDHRTLLFTWLFALVGITEAVFRKKQQGIMGFSNLTKVMELGVNPEICIEFLNQFCTETLCVPMYCGKIFTIFKVAIPSTLGNSCTYQSQS